MDTDENLLELSDKKFEDLLNDESLIDDYEFQFRMYLLQIQQETLENLNESLSD